MSLRSKTLHALALTVFALQLTTAGAEPPHNVILFVPDGLRALKVTPETAPTMAAIRDKGVNFKNPHSLFPTFTTANASAMATGHYLGDTGDFSNTIYTGYPVGPADGTVTPFLENDAVLFDVDEHFDGNYLNEETILKLARGQGFSTAAIGKLGPTLIFDHTDRVNRPGEHTIVIDDSTGRKNGAPLSDETKAALTKAGLATEAPTRGDNGNAGKFKAPGTTVANVEQQAYFADVATKVVLPMFKARNKPFVLVFWSRDPDGTQHNQGDSLNALTPGINGPTSLAAIKNADDNLAALRKALDELGLAATTDIIVSADHGFSTISKQSKTSPAAKVELCRRAARPAAARLPRHRPGQGARTCRCSIPTTRTRRSRPVRIPKRGNGVIGKDAAKPDVVVAANGGSDLIYLPGKDRKMAARVVQALLEQDYVSGIFVDASLGRLSGHAADVGDQPERRGDHAAPGHRGQLQFVRHRLRPAAPVHGRSGRHRPATGSGHARQLQPRRHHEFHGRRRARLQSRFRRRNAGEQRRCRQDHCPYPGSERQAERPAGRPRHQRGDAGRTRDERSIAHRHLADLG